MPTTVWGPLYRIAIVLTDLVLVFIFQEFEYASGYGLEEELFPGNVCSEWPLVVSLEVRRLVYQSRCAS